LAPASRYDSFIGYVFIQVGIHSDTCWSTRRLTVLQLKLRKLQVGAFDGKFGEYEWVHKVWCLSCREYAHRTTARDEHEPSPILSVSVCCVLVVPSIFYAT
jgi:hypothetical protein